MSVYIKGMELPISCDDCEFCKRAISGYDWCCIPMVKGRGKPLDEPVIKPDWCPLVELPPHGRLIDADALYELLDGGYDLDFDEVPETKRELLRMITDAPTVIPAEEAKE